MKNSTPKISVVIPTFNSWHTLKSCLDSIYKQSLSPKEVIVINNGSFDGTYTKVKKYFPKTKLVNLEKNIGVTGGRNTGIEHANKKSNYLLFFDHDMVADKDMLLNFVRVAHMDKFYGIITPKVYYWEDKQRVWAAGTNINLWTGQVLFRGGKDKGQFEKIEEVQVSPAAIFVKRKVLDSIYGFDNRYFATYEDTDFCFRARKKGFKTIYTPKALAFHKISPLKIDEQKRLLSRSYLIARNRILFMGDYGKNFYLFLIFLPIYLLYFIKLSFGQKDFRSLMNYLGGVYAGLIEELFTRRILIHMPFSINNSIIHIIGNGTKKILDVACGDGMAMSILDHRRQWKIIGIDIYEAYVQRARERGVYQEVLLGDVRRIDKIFKNQRFDIIFCASLMEHLKKEDALMLLSKLEKLGKKIIIGGLPNGYLEKQEPHFWEGDNPYQIHRSSWGIEEFEERKYFVRGIGASFLLGKNRLSSKIQNKFMAPVKLLILFLENILAYLLAPIPFYFPKYAVGLLAVKDLSHKRS